MTKFFKGRSKKIGLPPGTIDYTGEQPIHPTKLSLFTYRHDRLEEKEISQISEALEPSGKFDVTWINIDGNQNHEGIEKLCNAFQIHPLTIEDILTPEQRPKMEDNADYVFLVLKMLSFNEKNATLEHEQVSLLLTKDHVISFQERPGDPFEIIRSRLRAGKGKIKNKGADYLFYALVDTIVDYYFVVLEKVGDRLEEIEDNLLDNPSTNTLNNLHKIKKEIISLRRLLWPLREALYKLERDEIKLIKRETQIYIRDIYDHTIQIIETVESFRDMVSGMIDLYQSSISNRLNQVMKVLTIISTIFIPLTFITGLYGMNFDHIPELHWRYGYYAVWGLSITVVTVMLTIFRKNNWL